MTKSELITSVAEETSVASSVVEYVVSTMLGHIAHELAKGGDITLKGFGKFSVKETAAREGRNPKTGASIQIAAGKKVSFKASSSLKEGM